MVESGFQPAQRPPKPTPISSRRAEARAPAPWEGAFGPLSEPAHLLSRFDLIANGGASLTLHFERAPFLSQERTVWLPWNSFYAMDTLVMKTEENSIPSCDLSGFVRPDPIIISSPLSTFFSAAPGQNPIVPETQVEMAGPRGLYSVLP